jgi:hypothetical protein
MTASRNLHAASVLMSVIIEPFMVSMTASVVWWSEFLATDPQSRVRFPALPEEKKSSVSGTGSTQPRENN